MIKSVFRTSEEKEEGKSEGWRGAGYVDSLLAWETGTKITRR